MKAIETELTNGIRVVYLHLPKSPNSKLCVSFPVGSRQDPDGKEGLAHILEHTVFCGTKESSEFELTSAYHALGSNKEAYTTLDETQFLIQSHAFDPENILKMCDIMRQILTEPVFDAQRLEIEKKLL